MNENKRIKVLNEGENTDGEYVLYWMHSAQRVKYNYSLNFAIKRSNDLKKPLLVLFIVTDSYPEANLRHYKFMLEGLYELKQEFEELNIRFMIIKGEIISEVIRIGKKAIEIITDRSYLRIGRQWIEEIKSSIKKNFYELDSSLIVAVDESSDKEEYSAATIRRKISKLIDDNLFEISFMKNEINRLEIKDKNEMNFKTVESFLAELNIDRTVSGVDKFIGSYSKAKERLEDFIENKLRRYESESNDPSKELNSYLSPYLHFGQISDIEIALRVKEIDYSSAFLEQVIVRRALAFNFVYYNDFYDKYENMTYSWALESLEKHKDDRREFIYDLEDLENIRTHDRYWNAAQNEMLKTGFMHNYMRMYWAKKIIEWSISPKKAYENILYLNNKYLLDGRDPNSYAGVAWCFGKHDRAWKEREIFGKTRYMNANGLKRKFDIESYCKKYLDKEVFLLDKEIEELLNEAVKLERNMSKLYKVYSEIYMKDKEFWLQLSFEEEEHAQLLESINIMLERAVPKKDDLESLKELFEMNRNVENYRERVRNENVNKGEAYEFAYKMETGAAEFHYKGFLEKYEKEEIKKAFLKLSKYDDTHSKIIKDIIGDYLFK